jgi:hypothetical protein
MAAPARAQRQLTRITELTHEKGFTRVMGRHCAAKYGAAEVEIRFRNSLFIKPPDQFPGSTCFFGVNQRDLGIDRGFGRV